MSPLDAPHGFLSTRVVTNSKTSTYDRLLELLDDDPELERDDAPARPDDPAATLWTRWPTP